MVVCYFICLLHGCYRVLLLIVVIALVFIDKTEGKVKKNNVYVLDTWWWWRLNLLKPWVELKQTWWKYGSLCFIIHPLFYLKIVFHITLKRRYIYVYEYVQILFYFFVLFWCKICLFPVVFQNGLLIRTQYVRFETKLFFNRYRPNVLQWSLK